MFLSKILSRRRVREKDVSFNYRRNRSVAPPHPPGDTFSCLPGQTNRSVPWVTRFYRVSIRIMVLLRTTTVTALSLPIAVREGDSLVVIAICLMRPLRPGWNFGAAVVLRRKGFTSRAGVSSVSVWLISRRKCPATTVCHVSIKRNICLKF